MQNKNAAKQRRYRLRLKQSGMVRHTLIISKADLEMIRENRVMDTDPMETLDQYMVKCLMKGFAFNFNSGSGIKISKSGNGYQVTGPAGD